MSTKIDWSRRQLLGGIPYSLLALRRKPSTRQVKAHLANKRSPKFSALDIARYFTASSMDFGARERARSLSPDGGQDGLLRIAASNRDLAGIPFQLGSADTKAKSWMVLSQETRPWCVNSVEIRLKTTAAYFWIASFCEWDPHEEQDWVPTNPPPKLEDAGTLGQQLAEATLTYVDGSKHSVPIRRGFEVSSPSCHWGLWPSAAVPHRKDIAVSLKHPIKSLDEWIFIQAGVWDGKSLTDADSHSQSNLWICALENPILKRKSSICI